MLLFKKQQPSFYRVEERKKEEIERRREKERAIMGIWDYVNGGLKNTRDVAKVASESAVWMSQKVVERMPDQEGWQKIGQFGLRIADHALDRGTKAITGGLPVYKFAKEELSKKNNSQYKPSKNENTAELAKLKATIQNLQEKNMELEKLKATIQNLQKKNMELAKLINGLGLGLGLVGLVLLILKIIHKKNMELKNQRAGEELINGLGLGLGLVGLVLLILKIKHNH